MKRKIITIFLIMFFIAVAIPTCAETEFKKDVEINETQFKILLRCYIESTVYGEFEPTEAHSEFGFVLFCPFGENSETKIYSEEGGDIIWHQIGKHSLFIGCFSGYNEKTKSASTMYGTGFFVIALAS